METEVANETTGSHEMEAETPNEGSGGTSALESQIQSLKEGMQSLSQNFQSTLKQNEMLQQQVLNLQQGVGQSQSQEPEVSEFDLESMSRKDYGEYIRKQTMREMENEFKSLKDEIKSLRQQGTEMTVQQQINEVKGKYKDFDDWRSEMYELHQKNGTLTVEQLYQLAKANHPDKVKRLEAKYNPPSDEKDSDKPKGKLGFGGFIPQNTSGAQTNQKMSSDEAVEAAWQELAGDLGEFFS